METTQKRRGPRPGQDWIDIVGANGTEAFARAFTPDVILETSTMNEPCVGAERIGAFFAAARGIYDRLAITHETTVGARTCLEWEGAAFGMDVGGVTILARDALGLIESVRLYHRPYHMVLRFSAELARRLKGQFDPRMFRQPL